MKTIFLKRHKLAVAIAAASSILGAPLAISQEGEVLTPPPPAPEAPVIDELVVTARLQDAASQIALERFEQPFAAEILGVDQIVRVGDSNVASALRRVTGLTLVDGKFVYVRGLGERYSSATLNGAWVPSPELSRNVIPLDVFPTSILSSVKVHKAYSPDLPALFGGGAVDIRTRGVPDGPVFKVSIGTGWDSNSGDDGIEVYGGDSDAVPSSLKTAINTYQGDPSFNRILSFINTDGGVSSTAQRAEADHINRQIAIDSTNRNQDFENSSLSPDFDGSIGLGNSWLIGDDWEIGVLANYESKTKVRNEDRIERNYQSPDLIYTNIRQTKESQDTNYAINFGINYLGKHSIATNSYLLRNEDDRASIAEGFDSNFTIADGSQRLTYNARYEERELLVNQALGEHTVEDGDFGFAWVPEPFDAVNISWIYSLSEANTINPGEATYRAANYFDPVTRVSTGSSLLGTTSVAQFNYLDLEDEVESYGMKFELPFTTDNTYGSLYVGWLDSSKNRDYSAYTANINASGMTRADLAGTPNTVLSNSNLMNTSNNLSFNLGGAFGTESYVAAQMNDAVYGGFDITWDETWRLAAGVRWEQDQYAILPYDNLDFSGTSILQYFEDLLDPGQNFAGETDDYYPTIALTYIGTGLLGTETFQIRTSYSETVVRPDLRERAPITYLDPDLGIRVRGNSILVDATISHFDLRTELMYENGNNLTASLFYKDITDPIETINEFASETIAQTFVNSTDGYVYGIEIEGLAELGAGLFLTGNVTLSDSETDFSGSEEALNQTNQQRRLTGHSKYVVNTQLGYDSDDGIHSASLVYNVFGERIFAGGLSPDPDQYEQPFHSLDLVYFIYPTESISVKFSIENILNSDLEVDQGGVTVIEEERGTSFGLDFKYEF
ncbi:TonB-dependent receptor plug domain-containing protein [Aurantivibrio plasticivorans]